MRIAAVERFTHPSRRFDAALLTDPADEVAVWELDSGAPDGHHSRLDVVRALPTWLTVRIPLRRRWACFVACALMHPRWRRTALVHTPGWLRQLQAGEIDEVVCFSTDGFPLVLLLAQETGRPCREMLATGTQYFGEFAFELLAVIPYAYWLHQHRRLEFTISSPDTRSLYYFSPNHLERAVDRSYVPITEYPAGEAGTVKYDQTSFPEHLDTTAWSPPPYREVFADDRFTWTKPPVVVSNKTTDEKYLGRGFVVNSLDHDLLLDIVGRLSREFTVIYNRPRASDIVGDHSELREMGDIEAVRESFPDVVIIQDLHARHPDLTFNELQLRVFASSSRFVSVLGGSSYLASYFGGTNVVYAQAGWETECNAYAGWFDRFSGARVVAAATPTELLEAVERELLSGDPGR